MRNEGRGSKDSLVTKAQRNRGAGPIPLLLFVCVSQRTGLPEGGVVVQLMGGVVDLVYMFREGDGVEDHCRSRRSHTRSRLPRGENVS